MSIWRPHTTAILIGGLVIILIAAAVAFMVSNFQPTTQLRLGTGIFNARIAATEASRANGLSGVETMKPNDALILVFPNDDEWGIWMKDMKVSIDILWLNSSKEIVYIVKNASPELGETKTFSPNDPARYVIELPAGSVQEIGVGVGDKAEFTMNEEVE